VHNEFIADITREAQKNIDERSRNMPKAAIVTAQA
jgi:hypothetical protein